MASKKMPEEGGLEIKNPAGEMLCFWGSSQFSVYHAVSIVVGGDVTTKRRPLVSLSI